MGFTGSGISLVWYSVFGFRFQLGCNLRWCDQRVLVPRIAPTQIATKLKPKAKHRIPYQGDTRASKAQRSVGGVATPAWSDVGSVISNEDAGHHELL
jgi:hypothetical protein